MILPRMVVTGPGVLEQIPAIIAELDIPERGLIVCDTNTLEIAGNKVISGKFDRNSLIKIVRAGNDILSDATVSSLKHKKDEVSTVNQGHECGVRINGDPVRFEPGDEIIFYEKKKIAKNINWDPGF